MPRKKRKDRAAIEALKLVKQQCKSNNIKFKIVEFEEDNNYGVFDYSIKELVIARKTKLANRFKKVHKSKEINMALTALHEMVHIWQWKRKSPAFLRLFGKDASEDSTCILEYASGSKYYSKAKLKSYIYDLINIEWEAESISIQLAMSLGIPIDYTRLVRAAKVYMYSFLVLLETGIYVSPKITVHWYKYLTSELTLDLSMSLLSKLCSITIEKKDAAAVVWENKICVKNII